MARRDTRKREAAVATSSPLASGRIGAKIALALVSAVLTVAVLELGARLLFAPPPPNLYPGLSANEMEDPDLLWRNRPSTDGPINALGFRGPEIALAKTSGLPRILSLGESTTYGDGVPSDETYSRQLEGRLREKGIETQVINAGVRAWSTVQSVRFLELNAASLAPDTVLVYHEVNDLLPTTFRGLHLQAAGLTDLDLMSRSWLVRIATKSRLVSTVRLWLARRQATATLRDFAGRNGRDVLEVRSLPYDDVPVALPGAELPWMNTPNQLIRVPDADREDALRRLIALTRSRGIRLVLIHPAYRVSKPHRCLLTRVAAEEHTAVLEVEDLLAADEARTGLARADYFSDSFHPNAIGHDVIARGLAALLGK